MTHEAASIELSTMPDLARLAREVARDGKPRVLREGGADVAVLSPAKPPRRRTAKSLTPAQIEAALNAFGAWKGLVDPEEFKRQRRALQVHDRPTRPL